MVGVLSCDTEGPWKVWGKTDSWFLVEPRKTCANFVEASKKIKISNFIRWFYLKDKFLDQKLTQQFPVLKLKGHGKFGGKLTPGFQFSLPNIGFI